MAPADWVSRLKQVVDRLPDRHANGDDTAGERVPYHDWTEARPQGAGGIPRLCPKEGDNALLHDLCVAAERDHALESLRDELPSTGAIWNALVDASTENGSEPTDEAQFALSSYGSYRAAALRVLQGARYHSNPYVTPHMFFLSSRTEPPGDSPGGLAAAVVPIFTHATRKFLLTDIRLRLEACDATGEGYLSEAELEVFVEQLVPCLRTVKNLKTYMDGHYLTFYKCHATRKFFFFLDPCRRGRISIDSIMKSDVLLEFVKLCQLEANTTASDEDDEDDVPEDLVHNWFAAHIMHRVYQHYVDLDGDWNGLLSYAEMQQYNGSSFVPFFIKRVFEVYPTEGYADEIDFKAYLNFVLATENAQTKEAVAYIWQLIDVGSCGFLARPHVLLFARELAAKLKEGDLMVVEPADVAHEVFDMANPADPDKIRLADLLRSGQAGTVLSILVDYKAFFNYDARESVLAASACEIPSTDEAHEDADDTPPPPPPPEPAQGAADLPNGHA
ncbi:putative serine/threonine-protein phosphatase 2A regulatory subunit Bprimeprime subunit TON2 [Diplonema papillatum]|nr:putative serine/threonine-protein phosphatase 2A regulatory subunit Bprimeprime subunit TON2 [Diplonema papillatum]|eukprot:gene5313-8108_t